MDSTRRNLSPLEFEEELEIVSRTLGGLFEAEQPFVDGYLKFVRHSLTCSIDTIPGNRPRTELAQYINMWIEGVSPNTPVFSGRRVKLVPASGRSRLYRWLTLYDIICAYWKKFSGPYNTVFFSGLHATIDNSGTVTIVI